MLMFEMNVQDDWGFCDKCEQNDPDTNYCSDCEVEYCNQCNCKCSDNNGREDEDES